MTDPKIIPTPATLRLVERVAARNPGAPVAIMANALTAAALNFRDEPARQMIKSLATYQDTGDLSHWDEAIDRRPLLRCVPGWPPLIGHVGGGLCT